MSDRDKTRVQLFDEVKVLRQQVTDIEYVKNEYQKVLDQLKNCESYYRTIADHTYDWEFWLNADDRLIYTSPSCKQITGYSQEDFNKDQNLLFKIIHANDRYIFDEHRRFMHKSQSRGEEEFRIVRKDGQTRWISQVGQPVYDEDGSYAGFRASNHDLTDYKKMEIEFGESAQCLRLLAENMDGMIWMIDTNLQMTYVSPSVERLLGYTADEVMTQTLKKVLTPSSFKLASDVLQKELTLEYAGKADRNRSRIVQLEYLCKDGSTIWAECRVTPVRDVNGKMQEIVVASHDITKLKSAEMKPLEGEKQIRQGEMRSQETEKLLQESDSQSQEFEKQLRQSEARLQEGDKQLRALLDASPESIFLMDIEANVLFANETTARNLGTDLTTLLKKRNLYDFVPRDIAGKYGQNILAIQKTGRPIRFEDERAGRTFLNSMNPLAGKDGKVTHLAVFSSDITDRKTGDAAVQQSKRKLAETNQMFQLIIDTIPLAIFWKDKNSVYLGCNQLFARDAGRQLPEDIIGKTDLDMSWRDQAERYRQIDKEVITTGQAKIKQEETRTTAEGSEIRLRTTEVPLTDMDGRIIGVSGNYENITEYKMAEAALKEKEEHYRSLFENNPAMILLVDPDSKAIIDANHAACAFYGWSREELIQKNIPEISMLPIEEINIRTDMTRRQKPDHVAFQHCRADGSIRDVEVTIGPLQRHGKPLLYFTVYDITERRELEAALPHAEKMESLGMLAGGIASDFNNLMTIVQGYVDMALLSIPQENVARERLKAAQDALEKTRALTSQLIAFSRGGEPVLKVCRIEKILRDALKNTLKSSSINTSVELPKGLWAVEIDEKQIKQCFGSLIENAGEAMPNGGKLRVCAENVDLTETDALPLAEGAYLRIVFEDSGKGISKEHIDKIFDPYFTTKESGRDKGAGLGLTVCYSVLKKHGGYIAFDSREGSGAAFILYLPAKPDAMLSRKRILIMDDNQGIRQLVQLYAEQLDYGAKTVADGQEAVNEYKKELDDDNPYSAVIMALSVRQGLGGEAALLKLKKMVPDIKAIVISGYDDPKMKNYADYGFQGALRKPFRFEDMKKVLEEVLA